MQTRKWKVKIAILCLCLCVASTCPARVTYVDDDATGANNGTSWADAYNYLQDALAEALSGDEIRVAQGVYRPDQSAYLDGLIEGDRDASFQLKNGVNLRGGYAGWGTPDPDQRDIEGYATILTGDLARNDPAVIDLNDMVYGADRRENSIHVVVGTGTDNTAVLEGFVVMGGNANDSGDDGWVSTECGGGLYNGSGSCTVRECVFMYNSALSGGAVYNRDGSAPGFVNCTFSWNAYAGMYNDAQSSPTLEGCVFEGNLSCGMANCNQSNPILTECRIYGNGSKSQHGGGISNMGGSCPVLNRCVFEENFTGQRGGALYCRDNSNAVATGCVFRKNRATWYGGAVFSEWSRPVFRRCLFEDNESNSGGAIGIGNWDWYDGAGSDVKIESCLFVLNHAGKQGGAISVEISHQNRLAIINCTFADNAAPTGRAILCDSFMHNYASEVTVSNCILWDGGDEVSVLDRSHVSVRYSDVQGGLTGDGNLDLNPMFVNPDAGDYRLQSGSPCVDKGDSSVVPEGALDLDENPRIRGKAVDMGAYEYQYPIGTIIYYVDDDATGANNGTSWQDAFNYLQLGMLSASAGDEIRVAQGVYKPHEGIYWDVTDLRSLTFLLRSGVRVVGGYAGLGSPDPNRRDVGKFETILSGDLKANDGPGGTTVSDNSRHVVTGSGTNDTAIIDGVTITAGYADGIDGDFPFVNNGAGMYNENGSPTLINCTFTQNIAVLYDYEYGGLGAAIYNLHSHPVIKNCTFRKNSTGGGHGVVYIESSSPMISDCTFRDNDGGGMEFQYQTTAAVSGCRFVGNVSGYGSGVNCEYGSNPAIRDCVFISNTAWYDGGALRCYEGCYPTVSNCIFAGNKAVIQNGGAISTLDSSPTLTNCTFTANNAARKGGAIFCYEDSHPKVANCILWGNSAADGAQIALTYHQSPGHDPSTTEITVSYSNVQGGPEAVSLEERCKLNWGPGNTDANPRFVLPGFWDPNGTPENADDDFWVNGDYHLKSQAGRWNGSERQWTIDEVTSPCIDAGDPLGPISLEPFPNGGIVNMGAYGGTTEASKSYFNKPPCELIVAGDINGDCIVNFVDFAFVALHWLEDNN